MNSFTGEKDTRDIKDVFADILETLMSEDEGVVYLDADLMNSFGTAGLKRKFPDRVFDMGVQEANMVGVAAGMSAEGRKPYIHSFGPFVSRRVYDQVFLSAGYARNSLVVIGSDPGVTAAYNGGTHIPFEDIALYRALPGATIFDIVDTSQFQGIVSIATDIDGVVYIRTPRKGTFKVYDEGTDFSPARAQVHTRGSDATIIASGIMLAEALKAEKHLRENGTTVAVIDPVTIKPLDEATIVEWARKTGAVVTAENCNIHGGLGDAVSALLGEHFPVPVERVGVEDEFGEVGTVDYLQDRFGLRSDKIVQKVLNAVSRK